MKDEVNSVSNKFGLDEADVEAYANAMKQGNVQSAHWAMGNIRRAMRTKNKGLKLSEFKDVFADVRDELYDRFGNLDELRKKYEEKVLAERNAMEAARKKAEEETAERQKHLDELSLLSDEEIDKNYMDALDKGDEATAREMIDEAARRKGYADAESDYQGEGAWAAPSNPGYESDEARRADVGDNAPDVNLEDMALGYSRQPDDYFTHPERYSQDTPHGMESTKAIQDALNALKRGEKNVKVKVYRAVPTSVREGKLRNGDWVTPSRKYAEMHGNSRLEGKYRIIEDEVPAEHLWWDANDANEFGYDDGKSYRYKNVKNNRKLNDLVTRDDNGNVIPPSRRFNSRKGDVRFSVREVNDKFNEELGKFTIEDADNFIFNLGRPSEKLLSAGVADKPIRLSGSKLAKKIKKHGFEPSELKDLPLAIENPIAVFDNLEREGNRSILTELKTANGNFLVAIDLGKGTEADFDVVSSVFGKRGNSVVNWINKGFLKYVNKEKALNYLYLSAPIAEASDNPELISAAKLVKNFVNPKVGGGNLQGEPRFSLRIDRYRHDLAQWKRDNNLPKDATRPQLPIREPGESAADFLNRVREYRKQAALWATAPKYEQHLLDDNTAQGQFNLELQRSSVLARIALQDSMLAVRKAQEAIMHEAGVDRLNIAEDAYTAENRSHGKGKNEFEEYNDEFLQPLRRAYNGLIKKLGKSYDNVKVYMIAKHGLERNAHIVGQTNCVYLCRFKATFKKPNAV